LHAPTQRIAQELAAKLAHESIAAGCQQIGAKSFHSLNLGAVHDLRPRVDLAVAEVTIAMPPNGVEVFQREAERIDALMAAGAARIGGVFFGKLSHGERLRRLVFRELRDVLWRARQPVAEEHFRHPVPAQNRARARGAGLLCEGRCVAKNPAAREFL